MARFRITGVRNFNVLGFQFVNGILYIADSDQARLAKWRKVWKGLRPQRKAQIREIIEKTVDGIDAEPETLTAQQIAEQDQTQVEEPFADHNEFGGQTFERGAGAPDPGLMRMAMEGGLPGSTARPPNPPAQPAPATKPVAEPAAPAKSKIVI